MSILALSNMTISPDNSIENKRSPIRSLKNNKTPVNQLFTRVLSGPTWARTRDPLIMSQVL